MRPRASAFVTACAGIWAAALLAQDSRPPAPQQPTFRTGTQSVRVDLYATVNGVPIADLRPEEVRLFEDGARQTVQTFERITFTAPSAILPTEPKTLEESRRLAVDPHSRLFVLFLPTADAAAELGPVGDTRRLLTGPVNDLLGADDLMAVMTPYTRIADLTFHRRIPLNDTQFLSNADIADPKHRLWDACYPPKVPGSPNGEMKVRHQELITFEALDALVEHLGGLREERKHILLVTDGFRLFTENPALAAKGGNAPTGFPVGRGPQSLGTLPKLGDAGAMTSDRVRECEADLNALALINHRNRLEELAQHARRNNVSFTPVSLARMQTNSGATGARSSQTTENTTTLAIQSSLRGLAEDTGGVAIVNTNDIRGHLQEMMTATSAYYLLGYTPTNAALDGKFRRIEVKLDRPGVRVHARPGYIAARPADTSRVAPREVPRAPNAVESAVAGIVATSDVRTLHVRTAVWTRPGAEGRRGSAVWVVAEIGRRQLAALRAAAPLSAQLTIQPAGSGSGSTISKRADLSPGNSFDVELVEPLDPGDYVVRLTVSGANIEPLRETVRLTVTEEAASLGEPLLLRRGPATGQRFVRTADPSFQRTERVRVEIPTTSTDSAAATLRDSKGAVIPVPVTVSERPDGSGPWRWITADVPLAPLAPAAYAIVLTQGTATRVAAFRVVP